MITLITGAPGTGKSAALVQLLSELAKGRSLYVDGIPDLKLDHVELVASEWPAVVPDGSAIVIDEVQRVWRPRGPGQKVPADIAALETHRHRGLDFFIVTQAPRLLDANVRALVGRHVHLRDLGVLGRWWYEWPECSESVAWKNAPIKRRYRLPKETFALYKSASVHVKPVRSFPTMLLVMVGALIGVGVLAWTAYGNISDKLAPANAVAAIQPGQTADMVPRSTVAQSTQMNAADLAIAFSPRIPSMPESAPIYDPLRVPRVMPTVAGCMRLRDRCTCYTEQGTDAGLGEADCDAWIANPPFNPWRERVAPTASATVASESASQ